MFLHLLLSYACADLTCNQSVGNSLQSAKPHNWIHAGVELMSRRDWGEVIWKVNWASLLWCQHVGRVLECLHLLLQLTEVKVGPLNWTKVHRRMLKWINSSKNVLNSSKGMFSVHVHSFQPIMMLQVKLSCPNRIKNTITGKTIALTWSVFKVAVTPLLPKSGWPVDHGPSPVGGVSSNINGVGFLWTCDCTCIQNSFIPSRCLEAWLVPVSSSAHMEVDKFQKEGGDGGRSLPHSHSCCSKLDERGLKVVYVLCLNISHLQSSLMNNSGGAIYSASHLKHLPCWPLCWAWLTLCPATGSF